MKKLTIILVILIIYSQNTHSQITSNKIIENYSNADCNGKGMFGKYKPSDELSGKRTRSSRHFRNPDGSITAVIVSGSSLNYEENGSWYSITREIEPNTAPEYPRHPFANTHNAFKSFYPASGGSDGILTILKEGTINEWLEPKMYYLADSEKVNYQTANVPGVKVNDNEIIYQNIYNNIDIHFIQNNDGRKMNIVLNNSDALDNAPANATSLVFEETVKIPQSWTLSENEGCINIYDRDHFWIARYEKPVFLDNSNGINDDNRIPGTYSITSHNHNFIVSVSIPVQWLKKNTRKYPVNIDPTINIYPNNTTYWSGTASHTGHSTPYTYSKQNDSLYNIIYYNGYNEVTNDGFIKFDLTSLSHASSISAGSFNYYCYYRQLTTTYSANIYRLSIDPVISSADTIMTNYLSSVWNGSWNCSSCWNSFSFALQDLTNILIAATTPGWEAFRIQGTIANNMFNFYGYGNPTYKPFLAFTYCETPGKPANLTSSVTGTTSANIAWSAGTPSGSPTVRYYWEVYTTGGVYVSGNNTTSTSTPVSGLAAGTSYFFRVQASTTCDNTYSQWDTSSVFVTCTSPGSPVSLSSTVTNQTTAYLQWAPGTPAGSQPVTYNWQICTTGGAVVLTGSTANPDTLVTGLSCGTMYYFKVQAYSGCGTGNSSAWAISNNFTTVPCFLTVPSSGSNIYSYCGLDIYDFAGPSGTYGDNWNGYSVLYPGDPSKAVQLTGTYSTDIYDTIKIYYGAGLNPGSLLGSFEGTGSIPVLTSLGANIPLTISFVTNASVEGTGFDFTISCVAPCSSPPAPSTLITSDINNYCSDAGGNITLASSGGSGNTLIWYTGNCGGTTIGTGNPLIITAPVVSTSFYTSWYTSGCTNSSCKSLTISVITAPIAPASAYSDTNNYCSGFSGNINLSSSGGSGTKLIWFISGCGSTQIGTGLILTLPAPTISTSYFAGWQVNGCNISACSAVNLNVFQLPSPPSTALSDRNNFCSNAGGNISLTVSGGYGTNVGWYRISCGGTLVGSGNPKVITAPVSSITYWARWENPCGNSTCASIYITVLALPVAPVSVAIDRNNLCTNDGGNINLSSSGGSGTSINWFTASCGGTALGTGKIFSLIAPAVTTEYWVRWTNTCGNSTCKSIFETIYSLPVPPVTISSDRNNFCSAAGGLVTLGSAGGSGVVMSWYGISCNYGTIGTGNTLVINAPTVTSTYWVNWQSIGCSNSSCLSVTVTVLSGTTSPVSIYSDRDTICANDGSTINLSASGGLGTTVGWYTVSCGGTFLGTGNPINLISPTLTSIYWANRQSSGCTNSVCISLTEIVNPAPASPMSLSSDNNNYCPGTVSNITLTSSGGSGTASEWSTSGCWGTIAGTGAQLVLPAPTTLTTYYNWWQLTGCNNSTCLSITIALSSLSTIPTSVTAVPASVCPGTATVLTESGGTLGTGANWYWYTSSCGGTLVGTSNTMTQYPAVTTTYWVRGSGTCNTTNCISRTVTATTVVSAVTLTGTTSVCPGSSQQYTATYFAAYTYTWTAPAGWTGSSTSNSIVYTVGTTPGLVKVVPSNSCGTGPVSSKYVSLNDTSVTLSSITASPQGVCIGGSGSTLTVNGGYLGIGGVWKWYSGSCGITASGTGLSIIKNPTVNSIYWVRAEGTCNTTHCLSVTVTINSISVSASSLSASSSTVCAGNPVTLTESGGVSGTGANWYWYSGSCGTNLSGTGISITLSPSDTATYYARSEGTCNTTSCLSILVNVIPLSIIPSSASVNPAVICTGASSSLSITGGSLSTDGAVWRWYTESCGGIYATSGAAPVASPAVTTTYYVRAEGTCNTTACVNSTVTVNPLSVVPTSATSTPAVICIGDSSSLSLTGGILSTDGAIWDWYLGSCGGTYATSGAAPIVSPAITTTYYIRAEGTCNTTACVNTIVIVNLLSVVPTSATATPAVICIGASSTLSLTGGSLSTDGAVWNWYTGSCGGTYATSGAAPVASPAVTTTYYVRAEGTCNTTSCMNIMVNVNPLSVVPTSATATPAVICIGASSTLSLTGGSLSTDGAVWKWYTGSCGGTYATSGAAPVVSPVVTTTYFVRAEGTCNTTACVYTTITVNPLSIVPTSATATPAVICISASSTLSLTGGSLSTDGAVWKWYTASCGGTYATSGVATVVSPVVTTTYYVRAEGTCNTTACVNTIVTVNSLSVVPSSATATPAVICIGASSTLSLTGGSLSTDGAVWKWYTGSCGGTYATSGAAPVISPAVTTTYYVRAEGICNTTACVNTTVTVNPLSIAPTSATSNPGTICTGTSSTLGIIGGSLSTDGAIWKWYTGSCGGTYATSGSAPVVTLTGTKKYYLRAEGICNTTSCVSITVIVNPHSVVPTSASANPAVICFGASSSLGITGGNLSTDGAVWKWYTGLCGGIYATSGAAPLVIPTVTTVYYVRAEGTCNTTACVNTTVTVNTFSIAPVNASANPSLICTGVSSILGVSGGSLGTDGAVWKWYTSSCGGTYSISGVVPVVNPVITTTYYVRAEGSCNTTTCASTTVTVNPLSIAPTAAIANPSSVCIGASSTLGITGGSLSTDGAVWKWYTGSCGGNYLTSGASAVVSPAVTTTYYVRAEGTCNTTSCMNSIVTVNFLSVIPTSAFANPAIVCIGTTSTLGLTGGSLSTDGAVWRWYSGSCGGTYSTSGYAPQVSPSLTTTYYVRAEGACNTTGCVNTTVFVNQFSVAPTSASANPSVICVGDYSTLGITGGSLSTDGAVWKWYSGSCGGTYSTSGDAPVINPVNTNLYYVRAEGSCNTTACESTILTVNSLSVAPGYAFSNPPVICSGASSTLGITGGSLSTDGAVWNWYTGSCGGAYSISGASPIVSPSVSTTYYVRADGFCNSTSCVSVTVSVEPLSIAATSAYATPAVLCVGASSILGMNGGSLSIDGAVWKWYTGSCGSVYETSGSEPSVNPAVTTTYYVRAEGTCNTTSCISTIITINQLSVQPSSAFNNPIVVCTGESSTLGLTGGSLSTDGAAWEWYTGSCGGVYETSGSAPIVSPVLTTIYYVRAEGTCNTTPCVFTTLTVNSLSIAPDSANSNPAVICNGASSTLSLTGGSLSTDGAIWNWYTASCGGAYETSGAAPVVSPGATTTYYARAEGYCNTTACVITIVTVNQLSAAPSSAYCFPADICIGASSTLGLTGGSLSSDGAAWEWYTGSCGGSYQTSGSAPIVSPLVTTTYYVRAEGTCNTTPCVSTTLTVNQLSIPPSSAYSDPTVICIGESSTLGFTGGSLSTDGAAWEWYTGSCGGAYKTSGAAPLVSPAVTTTYYARAEGTCNTTTCVATTVMVNPNSISPSSAYSNPAVICIGESSTLGFTGGSLSPDGSAWKWYSGSCGGNYEASGNTPVVSPAVTTIYYVRAEGSCSTTVCVNTMVAVNPLSTAPTFVNSYPSILCSGSSSTLGITGGSLSTDGATWEWYTGSCGGTYVTSGAVPVVNPDSTSTYYIRAEGICNTTACGSVTIIVNSLSSDPTGLIASQEVICNGSSSTLNIAGGSLGTNADWYWYSGSCGGTASGNGSELVVSPAITTTYYVRAEGVCNTTNCAADTIFVSSLSTMATGINSSQRLLCNGSSSTLDVTGGSLGTGGDWYWYSGSCGGTASGNGSELVVNPTITTTYYLRAEGDCNTTACLADTINVNYLSEGATGINASPQVICDGSSSTLDITGGSLGTGANWFWYTGSCGGTASGDGTTVVANPAITTIFYVRAEGDCNTTTCAAYTIIVNSLSTSATGIIASDMEICDGSSSTLNITGGSPGTGGDWYWYSGSCGGMALGNGTTVVAYPSITTIYYVRAEGVCNTTECVADTLTVNYLSTGATAIISSDMSICDGSSSTLNFTGGSLGTGGDWYWYSGSCGGISLGNGITIVVNPSIATAYYVRAEGVCNTTTCAADTIPVNFLSTDATGINASQQAICYGSSSTLDVTGGFLGTGANWFWYSGSCGGQVSGNGTTLVITPSVTTTYYVRAEGICNTTGCTANTVIVNTLSLNASGIISSQQVICNGLSSTLNVTGGNLGSNADWYWYSGACGGIVSGNGMTLAVTPTITTIYYVRAEGTCNTTNCAADTIVVNSLSIESTGIIASQQVICSGSSSTLNVAGGSLGTGASWFWYSVSCGGTALGMGTTIIVYPAITTTYYVRAEGVCNTSLCISSLVSVNYASTGADSILTTADTLPNGGNAVLTLAGGSTGTNSDWYWYTGTCGGTFEGTGSSVLVSPATTMEYFARAEGTCNTTSCVTIIVTVVDSSYSADTIIATYWTICPGASTTLSITGGILGTNANWYWYQSACGINFAGTGNIVIESPMLTTDYFVRAEGLVNTTPCIEYNITLSTLSAPATNIVSSKDTIASGSVDTLSVSGGELGTGGDWYWYSGTCGGFSIGNGLDVVVYPSPSTVFYARAEGSCNTTSCISVSVFVKIGYSVSGALTYAFSNYLLDSVWLYLRSNGNIINSTRSDTNGNFRFDMVQTGMYTITGLTKKPWGGVNATDAVKVKRHFAGSELFTSSIKLHAADVNLSLNINTTDAVKITRRFVGSDTSFTRGDWEFEKLVGGDTIDVSPGLNDTIIVNGGDLSQDISGICIGDVNTSYIPSPGAKSASKLKLNYSSVKALDANEYFELPVKVNNSASIGALSLILDYPKELLQITGIEIPGIHGEKANNLQPDNLIYNINHDELRIGWFENEQSMDLNPGDVLLIIKGKTTGGFKTGDHIQFRLIDDQLCELADENGEVINNITLTTSSIIYKSDLISNNVIDFIANDCIIFPNPAKDRLFISYTMIEDGPVKMEINNSLGEKVEDILDLMQIKGRYTKEISLSFLSSGVYTCKIIYKDNSFIIKRFVVVK